MKKKRLKKKYCRNNTECHQKNYYCKYNSIFRRRDTKKSFRKGTEFLTEQLLNNKQESRRTFDGN